MKLVLASKSASRRKVLEENNYQFTIDVSDFDEDSISNDNVKELVMELSKQKAATVAKRHDNSIILAADTLVYYEGEQIGQQNTDDEARSTLKKLLGKTHEVFTGLCLINTKTGKVMQDSYTSFVTLKNVTDEILNKYIASGLYKGKAGAYNLDDAEFKSFIDKFEGSYSNTLGLPIEKVQTMLKEIQGDSMQELKNLIRTIPNWPKEGIMFRDVTTLMKDPVGFRKVIDLFVQRYLGKNIDVIAGIEARGLIIGGAIAHQLGLGFIPIRKPGKLPAETIEAEYMKEYGPDKLQLHKDAIEEGMNVLIIDDLLATGGTCIAATELIEKLGGKVAECAFMVDLPDLGGTKKLKEKGYEVFKMIDFEGD